jgi:DNA polymerase elongation subunit (family B)
LYIFDQKLLEEVKLQEEVNLQAEEVKLQEEVNLQEEEVNLQFLQFLQFLDSYKMQHHLIC